MLSFTKEFNDCHPVFGLHKYIVAVFSMNLRIADTFKYTEDLKNRFLR